MLPVIQKTLSRGEGEIDNLLHNFPDEAMTYFSLICCIKCCGSSAVSWKQVFFLTATNP